MNDDGFVKIIDKIQFKTYMIIALSDGKPQIIEMFGTEIEVNPMRPISIHFN